jgi:hypothetical protein
MTTIVENNTDQNPLEVKMQELIDKLIEKHCTKEDAAAYDDDVNAIHSLIMYIRSIDNEEEILEKINTAILIPYSKMYVRDDWADTDWDWLTGQTKYDEISRWVFTDEERESIRKSHETIRKLVALDN